MATRSARWLASPVLFAWLAIFVLPARVPAALTAAGPEVLVGSSPEGYIQVSGAPLLLADGRFFVFWGSGSELHGPPGLR